MQMPLNIGPVHILGIGGIGMSAIAEIMHAKGYTVQGSDQKESANVKRLRAKGIRVFVGHDPVNLVGARYVVISTAVKAGNAELDAARAKGLPIYGETLHQYLMFTHEHYKLPNGQIYHTYPSLKETSDQNALWAGQLSGAISTIATASWLRELTPSTSSSLTEKRRISS